MAGGKQSPRQKMINLMYLVFIAMLALNMSKEVLTAFGLIEESVAENNANLDMRNTASLEALNEKASEQSNFREAAAKAQQIEKISDEFDTYLANLKAEMMGTVEEGEENNYEVQDKADFLNEKFFAGDKLKPEGQEFLDKMNTYREDMIAALGEGYEGIKEELEEKFDTSEVPAERDNPDGPKQPYLNYHFEGYPLIASKTKMTQMQNDIRTIEAEALGKFLEGELIQIASANSYQAIVIPEKTSFFNGERFKGRVVLGRYDNSTVPNKVIVNGSEQTNIQSGQVMLDFPAGAVGERTIEGEMQFKEGDSTIRIPITSKYAVVSKPNAAVISADKMNVVYRGVDNPMTISFAGIADNNVSASAPGLSKRSGSSYMMKPGTGKEVTINVTGTLPTGDKVTDSQKFRIKNLPRPTGMVSGAYENVRKTRSNLGISTVSAEFLDFDFDLKPRVTGFLFKVPGQPSVPVSGTKLNGAANNSLRRARKGDLVQFAQIKATVPGVTLKSVSDVTVELTD
ncbi:type IX secretion system motor protein PorM/GldM [Nonlabens xiamenensis]|uniref:type IX secretion system motor protein PorM/GldM n=1 Tax=Nonlabens xiamenensis TaxID=2341043 RepID=UPI000F614201|nr:gliding motility protein GldM [Nonlabens xiamenensis]